MLVFEPPTSPRKVAHVTLVRAVDLRDTSWLSGKLDVVFLIRINKRTFRSETKRRVRKKRVDFYYFYSRS